jgi:hypothetical protein
MSISIRTVFAGLLLLSTLVIVACGSHPVNPDPAINYKYVRDYQYQATCIFDLGYEGEFGPDDTVIQLYVFERVRLPVYPEPEIIYDCILTLNGGPIEQPGDYHERVKMVRLASETFWFYNDHERNRHYVVFNPARYHTYPYPEWSIDYYALGIYAEVRRAGGSTDTIGDLMPANDTLILKSLLATPTHYSPDHPTWDLMWRNAYPIPKGLAIEEMEISVFKFRRNTVTDPDNLDYQEYDGLNEGEYIQILGLDQINNSTHDSVPDGLVDQLIEVYRPDWGLLIFPHRTPFASDTSYITMPEGGPVRLRDSIPSLYHYYSPAEQTGTSEYYIRIGSYAKMTF